MTSRDDDELDRLAQLTRSQDPMFADRLSTARPCAPVEYRSARRRVNAYLAAIVALLTAAVINVRPVVSAVLLLAACGCGLAMQFVRTPRGVDRTTHRPGPDRHG